MSRIYPEIPTRSFCSFCSAQVVHGEQMTTHGIKEERNALSKSSGINTKAANADEGPREFYKTRLPGPRRPSISHCLYGARAPGHAVSQAGAILLYTLLCRN